MTVPRPSGTRRKGSSPVGLVKGIPWWQFEGSTGMDPGSDPACGPRAGAFLRQRTSCARRVLSGRSPVDG